MAADFDKYDKIYAMANDVYREVQRIGGRGADMSRVEIFLNELEPGSNASVPDPWYGNEDGYVTVYDLINKTCDNIIRTYSNKTIQTI